MKTTARTVMLVSAAVVGAIAAGPLNAASTATERKHAMEWTTVYEQKAVTAPDGLRDWHVLQGRWTATPEGLRKAGSGEDGLLMLKLPVAGGAVNVEYEAMSPGQPADLSLFLGLMPNRLTNSIFAGFASVDNTAAKIRVPGRAEERSEAGKGIAVSGRWHKVTTTREGGRISMTVDGKPVLSVADTPAGLASPFIALYAWNEGVFRSLRVRRRPDPGLEAFLAPEAREREAGCSTNRLELAGEPVAPGGNKLVFTGPDDVDNIYGKLEFGADGLDYVGDARGLPPDMILPYPVPRADGSYDVYGVSAPRGKPWRILRCHTVDGLNYDGAETVYQSRPGAWVSHSSICYNPRDQQIIVWRYEAEAPSHALWGYGSKDGREWTLISTNPVYHDHDAMTMRWDSRAGRYVAYQNTMQKWQRRYGDNISDKVRRVLSIRTSPDGIHWTPGGDAGYADGPFTAEEYLATPDGDDPVDLQFYLFRSFPYADRYAGMMLNYAPSPQCVNPSFPQSLHGPNLSGEWWVSADGLHWRRPYRDILAQGVAPSFIWHEPMVIRRKLMWIMEDKVYGLPEDRLFYAGSLCNAEFTTRAFAMPAASWLTLNAALGVRGLKQAESWARQGYIMVELLDIGGRLIPGYEKEKCIIRQITAAPRALGWGALTGRERAGEMVRLRVYLRDARIYSVGF